MSRIFLSYRRADSAGHSGRLYDFLASRYGEDSVFRDFDALEPGERFVETIEAFIGSCAVVLAIIGPNWASTSEVGRRIDRPDDFVRRELAAALGRGDVLVIPVLVEEAKMPSPSDLPDELRQLATANAISLSDQRWRYDCKRLATIIDRRVGRRPRWLVPVFAGTGSLAAVVIGSAYMSQWTSQQQETDLSPRQVETGEGDHEVDPTRGSSFGEQDETDGAPSVPEPLPCAGHWAATIRDPSEPEIEEYVSVFIPEVVDDEGCGCGFWHTALGSAAGLQEPLANCRSTGHDGLAFDLGVEGCAKPLLDGRADPDEYRRRGGGWLVCEVYSAVLFIADDADGVELTKTTPEGPHSCLGLWHGTKDGENYKVEVQRTDVSTDVRCGFWEQRRPPSVGVDGPNLFGCRPDGDDALSFLYDCFGGCDGVEDELFPGRIECRFDQAKLIVEDGYVVPLQRKD